MPLDTQGQGASASTLVTQSCAPVRAPLLEVSAFFSLTGRLVPSHPCLEPFCKFWSLRCKSAYELNPCGHILLLDPAGTPGLRVGTWRLSGHLPPSRLHRHPHNVHVRFRWHPAVTRTLVYPVNDACTTAPDFVLRCPHSDPESAARQQVSSCPMTSQHWRPCPHIRPSNLPQGTQESGQAPSRPPQTAWKVPLPPDHTRCTGSFAVTRQPPGQHLARNRHPVKIYGRSSEVRK